MSLASSFFCPSLKLSSTHICEKTSTASQISFEKFGKKNNCSTRSLTGKTAFIYRDYPYFPSLHHPLESELAGLQDYENGYDDDGGIGIVKFFQGKNIFITGATGLVGKAFVEKLLRSTSVGKIYVLIKAEDEDAALARFQKDIVNSDLFSSLREKYGNYYETFVKEKLVPVVGNICEPNLGMNPDCTRMIMKEVDIIVGSAASTTLNDRYDVLLDINVNATQRLMRFAKACENLKLFVHISTAYVNGRKEGLIMENPLVMGENGIKEGDEVSSSSITHLDLADEISLVMKSCRASTDYDAIKDLKRLGQERASYFGWYNAYHMTKAMGEMVLNEIREDTPVLIIRPTVIESSFKEPFPGWIQGNRMFDPVIIAYGKGQLPAFLADPDIHMDIVPVDMVVNSTIAAIAKHGMISKPQLNVYQVASGVTNPLQFSEFFKIIHEYFKSTPLFVSKNVKIVECFDNFKDFSEYTRDEISRLHNGTENVVSMNESSLRKKCKGKVAYAEQLCKMYEFIGFFKGRFHTGNTQKLLSEMSKQEKDEFEIDAKNVDWKKYFMDIHIPGLRKHVLNTTRMSDIKMPEATTRPEKPSVSVK